MSRTKRGVRRTVPGHSGFTLVEIMVVVAVIGLLAAMAMAGFKRAGENARNSRYASDLEVATTAFIEYSFVHGNYPADVTPSIMPAGMSEYLARMGWTGETSLGGKWDWDYRQFGVIAGVSVYRPSAGTEQLKRLDHMIDDGNLSTGNFRARSDGYISVIE